MTADSDTLARGGAAKADTLWPLLQKSLARAQRLPSDRMRSWSQQMMLRLALFWLSFAIAWAGVRALSELTLRRWLR
jgi:hypothetical protein